jgi:hypothetical protein
LAGKRSVTRRAALLAPSQSTAVSLDSLLKTFWESHDPTQGMFQGNAPARNTVQPSIPPTRPTRCGASLGWARSGRTDARGLWECRHRNCPGRTVLFCRRLLPAAFFEKTGCCGGLGGAGVACSAPPFECPESARKYGVSRLSQRRSGLRPSEIIGARARGIRSRADAWRRGPPQRCAD